LLLAALRGILGSHVFQKGSNITAERLRLDFSHNAKMIPEELEKVQNLVNEAIKENVPVICREMPISRAKKDGAVGVFESKYGNKVNVYTVGKYSSEICGGPHVKATGELGHFKIVKEEASSAGVRRIKAILE
jgi:alanyl-tRNA synthetase